jgi:hypothetical protein
MTPAIVATVHSGFGCVRAVLGRSRAGRMSRDFDLTEIAVRAWLLARCLRRPLGQLTR